MLLSICIPTYNRKEKVLKTLDFLCRELKNVPKEQFELIIGDNCSTDGTYDAVSSFIARNSNISINKNTENIGLVGNLIKLSSIARGKYIWYVGDDDIYHEGIVDEVFKRLSEDNPHLLFINHIAYIEGKKGESGFETAVNLNKPDKYSDGHNGIVEIWKASETSLMFISCIVYDAKDLRVAISKEKVTNLASPLFYSFYVGSKGKLSIIKRIYIENVWGNTSWSSKFDSVFANYIPKILISLYKYDYSLIDCFSIVTKYLWMHKRSMIRCLLRSFSNK